MATLGIDYEPRLKLLADTEVQRIHEASLEILGTSGIRFEAPEALELLGGVGCDVDRSKMTVRIERGIVEQALQRCPKEFVQKGRTREHDLSFSISRVFFVNHSAPYIRDLETGARRVPTLADVGDLVRLIDALEHMHAIFIPALNVSDQPKEIALESVMAEIFRKTDKPTIGASFGGCAPWVVELANAVGEDVIGCASAVPPMIWKKEMCEGLITYAKADHIVSVCTGIGMGTSGPATIAGTLVQGVAELLAGIVMVQAARPGVRVATATQAVPMDLKTGDLATGAIEGGLVTAGFTQMSHYYGLPIRSQFPMTDSKVPDQQAGSEKCTQLMLIAMAGNNYLISGGGLANESILSYEQLVIDNEVYGMVGRALRGIEVTDETMAVQAIREVASGAQNFLSHRHTQRWCRKEMYQPKLSDRAVFQTWVNAGSKDVAERAKEVARQIIATHSAPPLPAEVERELTSILQAAQRAKAGARTV
ncbi:MAG: trimethylamine methyltransferase family protein [Deltaproteobacteria bacterium]|nr:trimethylamine methyltransferase family protein [Deltaproteobacteria bacterium]